jgi:hypothetical protein
MVLTQLQELNINVKKATNKFDIALLREAKFQRIK